MSPALRPCPNPAVEALFWNKPNVWYPDDVACCPFCGEQPVAYRREAPPPSIDLTLDGWWYHIGCNYAGCSATPHTHRQTTPDAAIAAWNQRQEGA